MSHRDGRLLMPSDRHGKVLFLLKSSDAAFIAMMRWISYNQLKERYPDVSLTYGYLTKRTRIPHQLEKTHYMDARCISGDPMPEPLRIYYY